MRFSILCKLRPHKWFKLYNRTYTKYHLHCERCYLINLIK